MTVCNEEEEINRCFEVGGADYVNKSINAEELRARLRTQLKLADITAKEDRERQILSMALNNMRDIVIVTDVKGKVLFANRAAEESFGDDLRENNLYELAPDSDTISLEHIKEAIDKRKTTRTKLRKAGSTQSLNVEIIGDPADPEAVFITSRDVTEDEQVQDTIRQSEKMASVGRLAGGIAHDLNNILGGMIGYISLLKAKTPSDNPIYSILEHIDTASDRASEVIGKLLEFASVQEANPRRLQLNDEIRRLLPVLKSSIRGSLLVECNLDAEVPPVRVDPVQIKQLLMNLIYAASNAGIAGGVLRVKTSEAQLNDASAVCVHTQFISTTGQASNLVDEEEFQLAENASLGLAIVRDIIDYYDGQFDVQTDSDGSFTFLVTLPADQSTAEPDTGLHDHILVIDDEQIILQMLNDCFEMLGYKGLFASSGKDGIELFRQYEDKIGLVILDLVMPGMTGEQVLPELRKINPEIKVMISSAYSASQKTKILEKVKADAFLSKPFKINDLQDMIEEVLGRS